MSVIVWFEKSQKAWNNQGEIYISNSEWYIMARIYKKQPSISYVTKNVEISRQAIHKFIKNLSDKGLVEIKNVENNKKEKCIQLTALGEECYEKNGALKAQLEDKIAEKIGAEQVHMLKDLLKLDWKMNNKDCYMCGATGLNAVERFLTGSGI